MSKILVVEDNEMNRDMLCRRLEKAGYEIVSAQNGEEALLKAEEHRNEGLATQSFIVSLVLK